MYSEPESSQDSSSEVSSYVDEEKQAMLRGTVPASSSNHSALYNGLVFLMVACKMALFLFSLSTFTTTWQQTAECSLDNGNTGEADSDRSVRFLNRVDVSVSNVLVNVSVGAVLASPLLSGTSEEMNAAWDLIASSDPIAISADEVTALGGDLVTAARWPTSFGKGADTYIAAPHAMHNLHCLDKLRRDLALPDYHKQDKLYRFHTDHCLLVLAKQLMCMPSDALVLFEWVEGNLAPFPAFSVQEKCHDFESVSKWHRSAAIPRQRMLELRAEEGQAKKQVPPDIKGIKDVLERPE